MNWRVTFSPPSCTQRHEFTHHGTRVPSLLPNHSAKLEVHADLTQRAKLSRWEPGLLPCRAHSTEQNQGGPGWSSCFWSGSPVFLEIKQKSEFWSLLQHKELLLQKMVFFWVSHRVPRVSGKGVSMFTMQVNAGSGIGPQNESFPKSPPKALFLFSFSSLKT